MGLKLLRKLGFPLEFNDSTKVNKDNDRCGQFERLARFIEQMGRSDEQKAQEMYFLP
jgi:hypothetical protein